MILKDADALKDWECEKCEYEHKDGYWCRESCGVMQRIDESPTIDAKPVVHGEWTTKRTLQHDGEYYCSCCGFEAFWTWRRDVQSLTNFCPNCGADMRGERKRKETKI